MFVFIPADNDFRRKKSPPPPRISATMNHCRSVSLRGNATFYNPQKTQTQKITDRKTGRVQGYGPELVVELQKMFKIVWVSYVKNLKLISDN